MAALPLFVVAIAGCGGPERPSHLPPPTYERPELPPWEPEPPADPLDDPSYFEGLPDGEWADEAPGSPPAGDEPAQPNPNGGDRPPAEPAVPGEAPAEPAAPEAPAEPPENDPEPPPASTTPPPKDRPPGDPPAR